MESRVYLRGEGTLMNWRGAWASGNSYVIGDLAADSGAYFCIAPHTAAAGNEPGVGASWQTYWAALQTVTGTYQSTYFKAQTTEPYYRLVDGSSNDVLVRLKAGILEFYDHKNSVLRAYINMATGAITTPALITSALTVPNKTDGQIAIPLQDGTAISGTWLLTESSNVLILTRSVAAATQYYRMPIKVPSRTTALKGCQLVGCKISYTISGADTANDELMFEIIKTTLPATGSGATAAVLAGDDNADYDAAHDTKAERLTTGSHTLTVSIPSGERAFLAADEILALRCKVTDAATANLVLVLTGAVALYEYQEN